MPIIFRTIARAILVLAGLCLATGHAGAQCVEGNCVDGHGRYQWPDGTTYQGQFKGGDFHGQGTYHWPDGKKYEGEFRANKRNGHGTYSWPNGSQYSGQWQDGSRHGRGTFTWTSGARYDGQWHQGQKRGLGVYTYPDGAREAGRWVAGEIIEPMDPDLVAGRLAEMAPPKPPSPPEPVVQPPATLPAPSSKEVRPETAAAGTGAMEATPSPVDTASKGPAAPTLPAPDEDAAGPAAMERPMAYDLAVRNIPLVRKGKPVQTETPLTPRGRFEPVGHCRLELAQADAGAWTVRFSVENLTHCRFSVDAWLRQKETYLRVVSWRNQDAVGPKETKTVETPVALPNPPMSSDLTLKVQGSALGCP